MILERFIGSSFDAARACKTVATARAPLGGAKKPKRRTDGLHRVASTSDLAFAGPTGQTPPAPNGFPATPGAASANGGGPRQESRSRRLDAGPVCYVWAAMVAAQFPPVSGDR
jgi:hypothetical protein